MNNIPRRHHIVPQCYLKYFVNDSGKIKVFDKLRIYEYYASPKDLAVRRDFYRDYLRSNELIWEEFYSMNVENRLPETFEKIINKSTKLKSTEKILVDEVKNKMSKIIITQLFRTEKWRRHSYNSFSPKIPLILKNTKEKLDLLKERTGETYISKTGLEAFAKNQYLKLANHEITLNISCQILIDRNWILIRSKLNDKKIFTSDNPVVLYNEKLKSYKIEDNYITDSNNFIFFPISTQLFLMILPSNNTKLVDFGEYVDCIIDGTKEIIDFQNFGQMIQASRQVFI